MSERADNVIFQLKQFGLSEDSAKLYLYIYKGNGATALSASKDLGIARTKIYRLLEKLIESGLVIEEVRVYGRKFMAIDPQKFLQIVNEKERDLLLLKSSAPTLVNQLEALKPTISPDTKILHYRGVEGLKQVTWNTTKAKGIFRIYEIKHMNAFLNREFAEKVRKTFADNNIKVQQLTNLRKFEEYTEISEHVEDWSVRYIDPKVINIKFEIAIYNDVYVMYEYTGEDVFIAEIYNKTLAKMQKQIFDTIWKSAKPLKILNLRGRAELA